MVFNSNHSDYNSPVVKIVEIEANSIICQSQTIGKGDPNDPDKPTPGPGGFIFGD